MSLPEPCRAPKPLASHFDAGKLGILVFGPGRGEAIVVIFPDATLGVVDGCREPANQFGDPVREFIQGWHRAHPRIGGRIRFVALTHPHDDHYAGLANLISEYGDAIDEIWSTLPSGGHYAKSYIQSAQLARDNPDGVREDQFHGLVRMHEALLKNVSRVQVLQRGRHDVLMLKMRVDGRRVRVRCIAPCHNDILLAQQDLMNTMRSAYETNQRPRPHHDPNLTSGALVVSWGYSRVLLGGDLLLPNRRYRGWDAARANLSGPVQVVKVAHHASAGAQDWALLQQMQPKLAIVTPFKEGKRSWPPQQTELERLSCHARVALTAPPFWLAPSVPLAPRNPVKRIEPNFQGRDGYEDAVGVCLDSHGRITKVVLCGRASFFDGGA